MTPSIVPRVSVGVGDGVSVAVGIGVSVSVGVGVRVSVGVGVSEGRGVTVMVGVEEGIKVAVGVAVGITRSRIKVTMAGGDHEAVLVERAQAIMVYSPFGKVSQRENDICGQGF